MQSQGDGSSRVGVYVCHCGGNISDVVNVERVAEAAGQLPGVAVAREYVFMCSDPGQALIDNDIRQLGLDAVVVAACSPSLHELTFRRTLARAGLNPYQFEPANIREQVSWCHSHDPERATQKAMRLVAAAVAKARLLAPLEMIRVDTSPRAVVIGAGVAGCAAVLSALDCRPTWCRELRQHRRPSRNRTLLGQTPQMKGRWRSWRRRPFGEEPGHAKRQSVGWVPASHGVLHGSRARLGRGCGPRLASGFRGREGPSAGDPVGYGREGRLGGAPGLWRWEAHGSSAGQ